MDKGLSKILASAVQTEAVVTCAFCGEKHKISEETFFVFYGDIGDGLNGELISGNIDAKGKVIGSTVLCKKHRQVMEFAQMFMGENTRAMTPTEPPKPPPIEYFREDGLPTKRR
jgi:hypothetical protein